jgi:hypothetical protein
VQSRFICNIYAFGDPDATLKPLPPQLGNLAILSRLFGPELAGRLPPPIGFATFAD